jgi:predicted acetyltransferase
LVIVVRVKSSLREATPGERALLARMLAEYLFEFDGRTEPYPYLDLYWEEPGRRPFLIEVDGEPVGLCLIRDRGHGWSVSEFWVQPRLRRFGVGRTAVEALAERGRAASAEYLEAKVHPDNGEALPFWIAAGFDEVEGPGTGVIVTRRSLSTCAGVSG